MKQPWVTATVIFGLASAVAAEALAQANPNTLVSQRRGAMYLQAKYYLPLLAMAQGKAPFDARAAQRNAELLAVLSQLPWDDFLPHTVTAKNTRAKEDIYKDASKFRASIETVQAEVQKLGVAARSADESAVRTATQSVGRACNSCHESFATFEWRFPVN
jgi:cytochrome c556